MILDFTITAQHIRDGRPNNLHNPISLALKEKGYRVGIYPSGMGIKDQYGQWWEAKHTKKTHEFMNRLAGKRTVKPGRFRLRLIPD